MLNLDGNTAIVTGAGQGIGREIALLLGEKGAAVAVIDVNLEAARETVSRLRETGGEGLALRCDIVDYAQVQEGVKEILAWKDRIHFLVNNAGITRDNLLLRMSEEEWNSVISVNLTGTFNMTKVVAKHMFKKRFGRVVNIASVIGQMGNAGQSNYAASKAGIIGFTKSVAREFAPRGVNVNAIAPGFIETAMTSVLSEERQEGMRRLIPLGKFGTGREVAKIVLFLVSELSDYVTGQVINCDGGMLML
ncbi:MAG: 3-oxoacyl-[acyl-carrier-protein] reductase [Candidatus Krumholzibacteriota bacterium]|nr:3-oxoacyl-[acyl-carrier-protein] reductase [Candidatus Krumholzibacteriota bacterium]